MDRRIVAAIAVVVALGACTSAGDGGSSGSPTEGVSTTHAEGSIVFNRQTGAELAVFTIDLDGSNERQIRVVEDFVTLSPDGSRFIGAILASDGRITPETFDFDGSGHSLLSIADPTLQLGDVRWSPDGARVLAGGWDDTDPSRAGLYTFRSTDGDGLVRLTDPGDPNDYPVGYSPDGSKILLTREVPPYDHSGPMTLMAVNADGSGLVRLNPHGTTAGLTFSTQSASWSPDGRHVAFVASSGSYWEDPRAVFVVDANGTSPRRITPWGGTLDATWSPDGRWIAFDKADAGPHDLYVIHPDGSGLVQITSAEEDGLFSFGPVWSPDSTELLFVRGLDEFDDTDLWTAKVDGTGMVQVTHSSAGYGGYAWVPPLG